MAASSASSAAYPGKPGSEWHTWPTPASWLVSPVSIVARDGEHMGVTWKLARRSPSAASRSRLGVAISDPKQPGSEKPMSSHRTTTTFGASGGAVGRGGHHEVERAIVRPTVPWKPAYGSAVPAGGNSRRT